MSGNVWVHPPVAAEGSVPSVDWAKPASFDSTAVNIVTTKFTPDPKPAAPEPTPRTIGLPFGGEAAMLTREQLTILYRCSHGELGRLLVRKMAPCPIRVDGQILWFLDEARSFHAQVTRTLERWRKR